MRGPTWLTHRVLLRGVVVVFQAGFWGSVGGFFGVLVVITLLYPVSNVIRNLVLEKEMRLREG